MTNQIKIIENQLLQISAKFPYTLNTIIGVFNITQSVDETNKIVSLANANKVNLSSVLVDLEYMSIKGLDTTWIAKRRQQLQQAHQYGKPNSQPSLF